MAKIVTYQCPGANGHDAHHFDYLHHPSVEEDPVPRFCGTCGYDSQTDEFSQGVTAPHVLSGRAKAITQSADQTYRGMEAAGENAAMQAAEHLGVDKSEMSDLKITNLNDNLREGDVAAKMPENDASRMIAKVPTILGHQGAEVGRFFADSTPKTGREARAGAKAATALGAFHAERGAMSVAAAETGRF